MFAEWAPNVNWYGPLLSLGYASAWLAMRYAQRCSNVISPAKVDTFAAVLTIGTLLSGHFGAAVLYPIHVNRFLEGMSFHSGLLGAAVMLGVFCIVWRVSFWQLSDLLTTGVPIAIFFGRLGSFFDDKLYGLPTQAVTAVVFGSVDLRPRHPYQLYEGVSAGLFLFVTLQVTYRRYWPSAGLTTATFLILYSAIRALCEEFREDDRYFVKLMDTTISLAQLYCLPTFLLGLLLVTILWRNR